MSLRRKTFYILASIFLLAALPLVLAFSFSLFNTYKLTTENSLRTQSHQILLSLDRFFFERIADIQTLANYKEILDGESTRSDITPILKGFIRNYKIYDTVSVLNEKGIVIAHTNQLHIGTELPSTTELDTLFQSKEYKIWYEFLDHKINVMRIGYPIFKKDNTPFRIIVFEITMERIHFLLKDFYQKNTEITLCDLKGNVLFSTIQKKFNPSSPTYANLFNADGKPVPELSEQMTIRNEGGEKRFSHVSYNRGYIDFKAKSWLLIVEQDFKHSFEKTKELLFLMIGIMLLGLLGAGSFLIAVANKISQPIIAISNIADEIGKGNFEATQNLPQRDDELGVLSIRLKQMAEKIQASLKQIKAEKNQVIIAMNEAQSASQAKDSFLSVMSHEMRTPLNAVIGFSQIIQESGLDKEVIENAQIIGQSGKQLLQIVNDVLDYTKVAHGKMEFESISFSILKIIETSVALYAPQAHAKELELFLEVSPQFPQGVIGDPNRLQQIINNLLSNAIKFTEKGHILIRLQHEFSTTNPKISISVTDTGIGIENQYFEKLFEPFLQVDSSVSRKFGGTGLGLAISKKIIEHWNGSIHLQSLPHKGSTFTVTFTLPLDLTYRIPFALPLEPPLQPVLLFDRHLESRRTLEKNLNPFLKIESSDEFETAMEGIKEKKYLLIILSIPLSLSQIPLEWYKTIFSSSTPCLFLSRKSLRVNIPAPHRSIEKPVDYHQLLKVISEMIQSKS